MPRIHETRLQAMLEAGEDTQFLDAMRLAHIKGALVGVESVTEEGLKAVFKTFNSAGDNLAKRLRTFKEHGVHVLGSFIFGLPTDRKDTFAATVALAREADLTFAQFVMMTPFPGTVDFDRWEKNMNGSVPHVDGVPITRYWLIPAGVRPKMFSAHETMSSDEIRERTQGVWDTFYSLGEIWERSKCVPTLRGRLAFLFISKLYRQMYANTGISTDSARRQKEHGLRVGWPCRAGSYSRRSRCRSSKCRQVTKYVDASSPVSSDVIRRKAGWLPFRCSHWKESSAVQRS